MEFKDASYYINGLIYGSYDSSKEEAIKHWNEVLVTSSVVVLEELEFEAKRFLEAIRERYYQPVTDDLEELIGQIKAQKEQAQGWNQMRVLFQKFRAVRPIRSISRKIEILEQILQILSNGEKLEGVPSEEVKRFLSKVTHELEFQKRRYRNLVKLIEKDSPLAKNLVL